MHSLDRRVTGAISPAFSLDAYSHPIAAHRDSVLIEIEIGKDYSSWRYNYNDDEFSSDYFIYSAGDAAAYPSRPPSLSLLPPCYLTEQEDGRPKKKRYMHDAGIALMRRAQDEVLVAALDFCEEKREEPVEAELCLLRSGDWQWELKRLPQPPKRRNHRSGSSYQNICATNDDGHAVRFVGVFPRCCCGCSGATFCAISRYAYTITTWDLRMDDVGQGRRHRLRRPMVPPRLPWHCPTHQANIPHHQCAQRGW
jgi:hypothetical protein